MKRTSKPQLNVEFLSHYLKESEPTEAELLIVPNKSHIELDKSVTLQKKVQRHSLKSSVSPVGK
jgi:hypothetical protein